MSYWFILGKRKIFLRHFLSVVVIFFTCPELIRVFRVFGVCSRYISRKIVEHNAFGIQGGGVEQR